MNFRVLVLLEWLWFESIKWEIFHAQLKKLHSCNCLSLFQVVKWDFHYSKWVKNLATRRRFMDVLASRNNSAWALLREWKADIGTKTHSHEDVFNVNLHHAGIWALFSADWKQVTILEQSEGLNSSCSIKLRWKFLYRIGSSWSSKLYPRLLDD